jgi:hypothetical protein
VAGLFGALSQSAPGSGRTHIPHCARNARTCRTPRAERAALPPSRRYNPHWARDTHRQDRSCLSSVPALQAAQADLAAIESQSPGRRRGWEDDPTGQEWVGLPMRSHAGFAESGIDRGNSEGSALRCRSTRPSRPAWCRVTAPRSCTGRAAADRPSCSSTGRRPTTLDGGPCFRSWSST